MHLIELYDGWVGAYSGQLMEHEGNFLQEIQRERERMQEREKVPRFKIFHIFSANCMHETLFPSDHNRAFLFNFNLI